MDVSAWQVRTLRRKMNMKQIAIQSGVEYIKVRKLAKGKNILSNKETTQLWKLYTRERIVDCFKQFIGFMVSLYLMLVGLVYFLYIKFVKYTRKVVNKFKPQQLRML